MQKQAAIAALDGYRFSEHDFRRLDGHWRAPFDFLAEIDRCHNATWGAVLRSFDFLYHRQLATPPGNGTRDVDLAARALLGMAAEHPLKHTFPPLIHDALEQPPPTSAAQIRPRLVA